MSETRFHGARVKENTDLVTAINDIDSSVIGIVATADDADSDAFPLNKPVLITRVANVLGKAGTTGTLYKTLKAISDQTSPKVIVVRVAEAGEEGETQDQLVIGGSQADGSYTGMYALLVAEQDEALVTARVFWRLPALIPKLSHLPCASLRTSSAPLCTPDVTAVTRWRRQSLTALSSPRVS